MGNEEKNMMPKPSEMKARSEKAILFYFLLLASSFSLAHAAGKGSTGFNFLKVGAGARQMAMANCAVSVDGDVNSASYNPATLADVAQQEVGFLHTQFLEDIQYQYMGYAYPHSRLGTFGITFNNVTYGDIQGYDSTNRKTGTIKASDMALG